MAKILDTINRHANNQIVITVSSCDVFFQHLQAVAGSIYRGPFVVCNPLIVSNPYGRDPRAGDVEIPAGEIPREIPEIRGGQVCGRPQVNRASFPQCPQAMLRATGEDFSQK